MENIVPKMEVKTEPIPQNDKTDENTSNRTDNSESTNQTNNKFHAQSKMSNALSQLLAYGGMSDSEDSAPDSEDSETDSETDSSENVTNTNNLTLVNSDFREAGNSHSSSDYDSDSSSSDSEIGAWGITKDPENKQNMENNRTTRTKGEFSLEDLPPIEDLKISVSQQDCIEIGVVSSVIEQLVIVQSYPGTAAYDIDTLFFLDRGERVLGKVFDVLGPVTEPYYAIRFNSYQMVMESGVQPGTPVYCAPHTSHTNYVFVSELMKVKGSDASWEHNNEPPERYLDYSDDETEKRARRNLKHAPKPSATATQQQHNSLERNRKFEIQMNNKNILMSEQFGCFPSTSAPPFSYAPPRNMFPPVTRFHPPPGAYSFHQSPIRLFNPNVPPPALRPPVLTPPPCAAPIDYYAGLNWGPPPPGGNFGKHC